jgi:NAD(P)-dependent dehydrogenase (short-subunit alcohol dehydrogenase family)
VSVAGGAFHEKVVIVTGASHGIGEEIALALAAQGARLVLAARRADELERVVEACRHAAAGGAGASAAAIDAIAVATDAIAVATDVTIPSDCERLVSRAIDAFGRVDMLVNNAGLGMWARVDEVRDLSIFDRVMRVNYFGAVHCTVYALPHLKASHGRILCVSSLAGRSGVPLRSGYAASKHAMNGFFDSLRIELRDAGVTVTLVCPGFVGTGAQGRNLGATGAPLGASPVKASAVMTAEECARIAVDAAAARRREVILSARGRVGLWLKPFFPALVDGFAARAIARGK